MCGGDLLVSGVDVTCLSAGGAITSARSAVSSWFRSWSVEEEEDADVARSDAVSDAAAAEEATEETR